ncbi:VRR-NUC domain-containing protein [Salmonella enterica]|nr:VRR-NUC domain-containing protein [Salmonella enterica]EKK6596288.1 VRR-NUC domain-containing protein [Salmonella enterica]
MNKRESTVQKSIWARLGFISALFRVNTGRAWLSGLGPRGCIRQDDGSVIVEAARPIALGFANPAGEPVNGTADLIGWTSIEITPEMVGQKIAVFTSVETKRQQGGRVSPEQIKWSDQVTKAGGIAIVANSDDLAEDLIQKWVHHHAAKVWNNPTQYL